MNTPEADLPIESQKASERYADRAGAEKDCLVIPVLMEEVEVSKRISITGIVRVTKVVHNREELVDVPLISTGIKIERMPMNQIVEGPLPVRYEGETAIYSVVEEVIVVTKQFLLKEELRVTRQASEMRKPQKVTVRSEELLVQREATLKPNSN